MSARLGFVGIVLAGVAMAQSAQDPAVDLGRAQRELQQRRAEAERLLDLRIRHDLGLPIDGATEQFATTAPMTTDAMDRARRELREQEAANSLLLQRFQKLRSEVEQLRQDAAVAPAPGEAVVPQAGSAAAAPRQTGASPRRQTPTQPRNTPAQTQAPTPAAPAGESAPAAAATAAPLDPIRGQIHGSEDHLRVAQALFKAALALVDQAAVAREQQRTEAAQELDQRAKERLQRALTELGTLGEPKTMPFPALFCMGRCRELLFRLAERYDGLVPSMRDYQRLEAEVRAPFLEISRRDEIPGGKRGEIPQMGPWGLAAQTALEHFRWTNQHGSYRPSTPIEALTWPGASQQ